MSSGAQAWLPMRETSFKTLVGAGFALGLLALLEWLLYRAASLSFTTALRAGSSMPLVVFIAGCVIGMAWEYVGQFAAKSWHYPPLRRHLWLIAILPLFWGIFMLVMQDGYAIARALGLSPVPAVLISTTVIGVLIEGVNLYTRSWVYTGTFSAAPFLVIGWLVFLAYTFVMGFNAFFLNPFGL